MFDDMEFRKLFLMLLPVILIHYTLVVLGIVNLVRRKKVRFNNKFFWGAVIIFVQVLGPILYFLLRGEEGNVCDRD